MKKQNVTKREVDLKFGRIVEIQYRSTEGKICKIIDYLSNLQNVKNLINEKFGKFICAKL